MDVSTQHDWIGIIARPHPDAKVAMTIASEADTLHQRLLENSHLLRH